MVSVEGEKLLRRTAKTDAIVRFEPFRSGGFIRAQPKQVTAFNKIIALFRGFHRAADFLIIRPVLDFRSSLSSAIGQQPGANLVVIFRDLYGGCKRIAGDALEAEQLIVQWTIVVVFTERSRQAGAAFVHGPTGDGESADAFARTVWRLLG